MDAVPISAKDRERIEDAVAAYRDKLEFIYAMAFLQGQIDAAAQTTEQLRAKA